VFTVLNAIINETMLDNVKNIMPESSIILSILYAKKSVEICYYVN